MTFHIMESVFCHWSILIFKCVNLMIKFLFLQCTDTLVLLYYCKWFFFISFFLPFKIKCLLFLIYLNIFMNLFNFVVNLICFFVSFIYFFVMHCFFLFFLKIQNNLWNVKKKKKNEMMNLVAHNPQHQIITHLKALLILLWCYLNMCFGTFWDIKHPLALKLFCVI